MATCPWFRGQLAQDDASKCHMANLRVENARHPSKNPRGLPALAGPGPMAGMKAAPSHALPRPRRHPCQEEPLPSCSSNRPGRDPGQATSAPRPPRGRQPARPLPYGSRCLGQVLGTVPPTPFDRRGSGIPPRLPALDRPERSSLQRKNTTLHKTVVIWQPEAPKGLPRATPYDPGGAVTPPPEPSEGPQAPLPHAPATHAGRGDCQQSDVLCMSTRFRGMGPDAAGSPGAHQEAPCPNG